MIKIGEYDDILKTTTAGGTTKSFKYQTPDTRFHTTVGFVTDYKIGCGEILQLFMGRNLYTSALSEHADKGRRYKIDNREPYLGKFLKEQSIKVSNVNNLLNYVVEYDAEDYGCGKITNVFLRIPLSTAGVNANVGFNIDGSITTIYSTPLDKEATQSNNSNFEYNYANSDILKYANEYKSTGAVSIDFMEKIVDFFGKKSVAKIKATLHEPYLSKFDAKYKEVKNNNNLKEGMFDL